MIFENNPRTFAVKVRPVWALEDLGLRALGV